MEADEDVFGASSSSKRQESVRDYLDETRLTSRADSLVQHLQAQPYVHRVRAGHSALEDVDDDDDDDTDISITTWDSEEEERRALQEWEENVQQLNLALQVMLLPFFGKWLGRKWSYWGAFVTNLSRFRARLTTTDTSITTAFTRFQKHGMTASFFGLDWFWAPTTEISGAAVALLQP